jgi:metal-responsive CopG/Arc/MetJ family transcriptional regulator
LEFWIRSWLVVAIEYKNSYTTDMKTAISLPDPLFQRGEQYANRHALGRSELYARALEAYLTTHDDDTITAALNDVYATENSSLEPEIRALSLEALRAQEWAG